MPPDPTIRQREERAARAVVEAAREVHFVFAEGAWESVAHKNDFRGLTEALAEYDRQSIGSAVSVDDAP